MSVAAVTLLTWLLAALSLAVLLFSIRLIILWRALERAGAPCPVRILTLQILLRVRRRPGVPSVTEYVGSRAWMEWDFRWGPHGAALVTVSGVSRTGDLDIASASPIMFPDILTTSMVFVPSHTAATKTLGMALEGHIRSAEDENGFAEGILVFF